MFSKLNLFLLLLLGPSLCFGVEFNPVIHQVVLSREVVYVAQDETDFQISELHQALSTNEDCEEHDHQGKYSEYELTIAPQEINEFNASAFTSWFEGVNEDVIVTRVVFQTCRGIF